MLELVEMRYKGLKRIAKLFPEKDTGFERYGGYELIAGNPMSNEDSPSSTPETLPEGWQAAPATDVN